MKNPYSKGNPCLNCFSTLCGPLPPSFLNSKAVVKLDDHTNMIKNEMIDTSDAEETVRYQLDETSRNNNRGAD